jgi:hypothetical protein
MSGHSRWGVWFAGSAAATLVLALLALAGAWRLGLLPLLFPPPEALQPSGAGGGMAPGLTSLPPAGTLGADAGNGQQEGRLPLPGKTLTYGAAYGTDVPEGTGVAGQGSGQENSQAGAAEKYALRHEIEQHYIDILSTLGGTYQYRLNRLVQQAYDEYRADQQQGKSAPALALARKYLPLGEALERQCDRQFYAELAQFKGELRNNDLPLDTANLAQRIYEYDKAARKKEIMLQAAKLI